MAQESLKRRIVVTGAGVVSAVGVGKAETLASLRAGRSGLDSVKYLQTDRTEFPVGEVKLTDAEMVSRLGLDPAVPVTRTILLGALALKEALDEAGLKDLSGVPFVNGTTVGGMDRSERYYRDFISDRPDNNEYLALHDCGTTTDRIASLGRPGKIPFAWATTISTACSSAANALLLGADLIRCGQVEAVVAGGSECLSSFHLNGFDTLMIVDREPCRPFDATRAGLNLGEGAAFLVIESEESAIRRGAKILAVLAGCGNACDAFHQTATSPDGEGPYLAMKQALEESGLSAADIDYVSAHGTGTPNNDSSESAAIRRIFVDNLPPVTSPKAYTGHTTSASGSIEAVFALLQLQENFIPVSLNFSEEDPSCIRPYTGGPHREIRNILSNAFGFGGNDSSIILSRV